MKQATDAATDANDRRLQASLGWHLYDDIRHWILYNDLNANEKDESPYDEFGRAFYGKVLEWIRDSLLPEDVFSEAQLVTWANCNGYILTRDGVDGDKWIRVRKGDR